MTQRPESASAGDSDHTLAIRVFGSTMVTVDDSAVDLGRRQVKRLAVLLGSNPGAALRADVLIEHLWPDDLPAHPRKALNVALSRLRSALGVCGDRLTSDGDIYCLTPDSVDASEFVALVEEGRDADGARAVECFTAALALWVGEPFADAVDAELLTPIRRSLEERRWFAVTRLLELLNERGEHDRAVDVASTYAPSEEGVIRERTVIAHAVALAGCGRKSEALRLLDAVTSTLRTDLGLDPSEALRSTERVILEGSVDLERATQRHVAAASEVFVGRRDELKQLGTVAPGRSISVVAEAGMGKTSLLDRFVAERRAGGDDVVRVDVAATPTRPLDAIAQLCGRLVATSGGVPDVPIEFRAAIARLCPDLAISDAASTVTRESLIEDAVRFIERRGDASILVIDDAQWLDRGSLDVVCRLVGRSRCRIVFGTRPIDDPRFDFMTSSTGMPGACTIVELDALGVDEVRELIASYRSSPVPDELVERVVQQSGGNALFVRLLVDRWLDGHAADDDLPSTILVAVRRRLDDLSKGTLDTLDAAATIGASFSMHVLRQLRPNADADLSDARSAGLVEIDVAGDSARFVHALVADVCSQLLADGRRIVLHDEIGQILEHGDAPMAEVARHCRAATALDPVRAIETTVAAASDDLAGFDWVSAARHLDTALDLMDDQGVDDEQLRAEIVVRRGVVLRALADPDYVEVLMDGCALARATGRPDLFVVAVTELCGHGRTTKAGALEGRIRPLLEEALSLEIAPSLRAELCASSMPLFSMTSDNDRGRELFREGWDLALSLDDPELEASVLSHVHLGFSHPDDFELLVAAAGRLSAVAGRDPEMIWESAFIRFQCSVVLGEPGAARDALDQMRLYAPEVKRRPRDFGLAFSEAAHATLLGDFGAAEQAADRALSVGLERFDESWVMSIYGLLLLGIRAEQGRLGELRGAVDALVASSPEYLPYRAVSSMVAAEVGDVEAARGELDLLTVNGFGNVVRDASFTSMLTFASHSVAAVGRPDEIETLEQLLLPYAGRMSWNGASTNGPIDGALARLAAARGDGEGARRHAQVAESLVAAFRDGAGRDDHSADLDQMSISRPSASS